MTTVKDLAPKILGVSFEEFSNSIEKQYQDFASNTNRKCKKSIVMSRSYKTRVKQSRKSNPHYRWHGYESDYEYLSDAKYVTSYKLAFNPVRHSVYCRDASKCKLLFKSKKKADAYIRFNYEAIKEENGYAPIRSYYCECCGGWHVTSLPLGTIGDENNYSLEDENQCLESILLEKIKSLVNDQLYKCYCSIRDFDFEKAKAIIDYLWGIVEDYDESDPIIAKLRKRLNGITIFYERISGYSLKYSA
ncbi:hypothetical protein [Falsiporphyromonas endometrii]|uniref:Uncharacterized protein n=1 Tax=Falsiporphyromonas endometrii TaxID=1387297 RepID=A0ABV9K954_9PORP